jgi:MFS family permease
METKKLYTVIISLVVALGGFLLGFDSAVISGAVPFIRDYFSLNDFQLGWAVSCLIFGAMAGNSVAGPVSDFLGRKIVLIITAVFFAVSAVSSALARDFWFFIFARILGGVGVGGAILIAPIYIAEIAPPEKRGRLVSFNQLNIVIGISVAYWSNYFLLNTGINNWRWMLGVETVPAMLYFAFLFIVPRSPRWLVQRGQDAQAVSVMEKVGGREYAQKSLQMIKSHLNIVQEKARLSGLFSRKMSFIMIIAFAIAFFQQITGINAILYYAPTIFEKTGGGKDAAFMQAIVIGLVNFGFTIVALWLIDKLGRKPLLLIGTSIMAISLLINAGAFYSADYQLTSRSFSQLESEVPADVLVTLKTYEDIQYKTKAELVSVLEKEFGKENIENLTTVITNRAFNINALVVLLAIIGFIAAFAISLGPVMWALLSEIFPNKLRGLAISVVGLFNSLVSFTVTLVFPWELSNLGPSGTFLIYGIFAAIAFIFVWRYIPETKGKSLEELETILLRSTDSVKENKRVLA